MTMAEQVSRATRTKEPIYNVYCDQKGTPALIAGNVCGYKTRTAAIDYAREFLPEREQWGTFGAALVGPIQWETREDPDRELRLSIMDEYRRGFASAGQEMGDETLYEMADRAIKQSRS